MGEETAVKEEEVQQKETQVDDVEEQVRHEEIQMADTKDYESKMTNDTDGVDLEKNINLTGKQNILKSNTVEDKNVTKQINQEVDVLEEYSESTQHS